jgi:hypothetical protein
MYKVKYFFLVLIALFFQVLSLSVYAASNRSFVIEAYQNMACRSPNQNELSRWVGALNRGESRYSVKNEITRFWKEYGDNNGWVCLPNNSDYINWVYQKTACRSPNQNELNQWVGALNRGESRDSVQAELTRFWKSYDGRICR